MLLAAALAVALLPVPVQDAPSGARDPKASVARGVEILLALQEGDAQAEWPYEGVYREGGQIPPGYRVGGTSISAWALLEAPGYGDSEAAQQAVLRATRFVLDTLRTEPMGSGFRGSYDVRGWGQAYALQFLLRLRARSLAPQELATEVDAAVAWLADELARSALEGGGWNYARGQGARSPAATFMTAPTLLALFEARAQGVAFDTAVIARGLEALEGARVEGGWFSYLAHGGFDTLPGSVGRNCAVEVALLLGGRGDASRVRRSLDWFLEHWGELEKRRRQPGTHAPPHMVAPYYFFYAHYYAAQAIELLPASERPQYRARLHELLFRVQEESGGWNDRVFPRSENFGTAFSLLALLQPELPSASGWRPEEAPPATK